MSGLCQRLSQQNGLKLSIRDIENTPTLQEKNSLQLGHTQRYTDHILNIKSTVVIARRTTNLRRTTSETNKFFARSKQSIMTSIIRVHVAINFNHHQLIKAPPRLRKLMCKLKFWIPTRHVCSTKAKQSHLYQIFLFWEK